MIHLLHSSKHLLAAWVFLIVAITATAADKSGVSPNTISLPKGPGSIEGLGESFQPTLNTGTAKYGIGIQVPPGTAGHEPSLSLSYDGGGGNGPLGYGWAMSLPHIQRRSDKGIPTYGTNVGFPRVDVFINETKEELVPQTNGFFFCKNEGSFIRYRRVGSHWEGTLPNGTKLEFGLTASGRIENAARVFTWLLERETDTHGNVIEYAYRSFTNYLNSNQKYLASVRYGPGAPPWTHFHFVTLGYEDRTDWFEDGRAGFLVRTGKRLKSIIVGSQGATLAGHLGGDFNGDGQTDYLNRRYELAYLNYAGTNSHWSLLERVTMIGADGVSAMPPAKFNYAVCNPPVVLSATSNVLASVNEPIAVMDNELVDLVDMNADGLPDILRTELGGAHTVSINRGLVQHAGGFAIQWSTPVAVDPGNGTAWNFDLGSEGTHLADMNGDGLADLVHRTLDDTVFFFANRGNLSWSERQEMSLQDSAPPSPFGQPDVRTADVDFDKRIDIIQSIDVGGGTAYRIWFNVGQQSYSPSITVEPDTAWDFSISAVQIADCNGDRVPDVCRVQANAVVTIAGLGYGQLSAPRNIVLPDMTLDDTLIAKARLTDLNGDGLADLVIDRPSPGTCWYWLNMGNYKFSTRKSIINLPVAVSDNSAVRWADVNGNGTSDLVYADGQAGQRLQAIEIGELLSGGLLPNMLTHIENGIGRVTKIEYAPSTRFALEDAAANRPWPDPLPFPVTVVSKVTTSDSLGHEYVTEFRYHDGYYDHEEKQFRGFAEVEQIDVGDSTAPTLVSRSRFDIGRAFEAMKGKLLRLSTETTDGEIFSDEITTWANPPRTLMVGTNGEAVHYAHPTATATEILERGQGTPRRLETESDYDNYGNQTRLAHYGIVEGTNRAAFDDEKITVTEYALNLNAWIVRPPKRQEIRDENGVVIARSEWFYDDETFSGANFGQVTIGNQTLRRDWITPSNPSAFIKAARTKFDFYGNPIAMLDPLSGNTPNASQGHYRELNYDSGFRAYVTNEIIHVGDGKPDLSFYAAYDVGFATVTSSVDVNGKTTTFGYDALGRLIHTIKPGDTPAFPTTEYEYALTVPFQAQGVVNYVETRQLDRAPGTAGSKRDHYLLSREFVDGLGRSLMTRSEAEPAAGQTTPRVAVSGAVQFNTRQKPSRILNPFFTAQPGSLDQMLAFENIEAPGWNGQFHENGAFVLLDLTTAHASSIEYDATLRTVSAENPDGTAGRMVYEPLVTRAFDENDTDPASPSFNTPMVQFSDGLGRLIRVHELVRLNDDGTPSPNLNTWTTRYEYDLNDALTKIIDSQNNVKMMRYDGLKRKIWMNDPNSGISTNIYDDASNLMEIVDAKGQRTTYTYDGVNRLRTEDFHDDASPEFSYHRSPDVTYFYDEPAGAVDLGDGTRATARHTRGALAYVLDVTGEEHTSFDDRGRIEWTVKRIPDAMLQQSNNPILVSYTTRFDHDSMDRITRMVYPDNDEVSYKYNARGLLEGVVGGPTGHIIPTISYLPSSQQNQFEFGNGVRTTYAYDARQRLTSLLTHHTERVTEPLIHFSYDFDGVSNIRSITDQRPASVIPASDPRRNTQAFAYDDLYRLTRVRYNPPTPQSSTNFIAYRYDRIGNMLAQTSDITHVENGLSVTDLGEMSYGGTAGRVNRSGRAKNDPPGPHALTSISNRSYPYDANGNMTQIDGLKCTWDFKDRLVGVEDNTMHAEYRYDYTDRRILKKVWTKPPTNSPSVTTQASVVSPQSSSVTYVGEHFEVREHDESTKYVFSGDSRVAHVTGSLSSSIRIQRLRLHAGWNLCSLAVDGLAFPSSHAIEAAYKWSLPLRNWLPLSTNEPLQAGTILWLLARTNTVLTLPGICPDPTNQTVAAGGAFYPSAGLNPLPSSLAWSSFDPLSQVWHVHQPTIPFSDSDLPEFVASGQAIFIHATAPAELELLDPALRIRYYHEDHLGSSAVMTDGTGALIEETAFLPSGVPRHEHDVRTVEEAYSFTQKERDQESGLHYFDARFLTGGLGRFASIDPKYVSPETLGTSDFASFLAQPQEFNLYAYALNNPIRYNDPTGLDGKDKVAWGNDAAGAGAAGADEAALWNYRFNPKATSSGAGTALKVVGKSATVISIVWKTAEFLNDPGSATGGQLLNEGAKTLVGVVAAPVGIVWSVLDLTGYGPSAILESTEKSIEANRKAATAYRKTAEIYRGTTQMINERAPKIEAQQRHAADRLKVLKRETAKWHAKSLKSLKGDTRSLEQLNAAIKRQEKINRRTAAELRRVQAHVRKLNAK